MLLLQEIEGLAMQKEDKESYKMEQFLHRMKFS